MQSYGDRQNVLVPVGYVRHTGVQEYDAAHCRGKEVCYRLACVKLDFRWPTVIRMT
jgi:hypothetical protein